MDDPTGAALIAEAIDERNAEIDEGAEAGAGDLLLAIFGAGLRDRVVVDGDPTDHLGSDPRDKGDRGGGVDEPLDPNAADDRRGLVSGTSPDPAPEITGDGSRSDCEDGFAAFEGECLPREVVAGLLALGLAQPEGPAPSSDDQGPDNS
ncbi:MAG: hypothetical protein P1V51_12220 [Deltaproteobacteria bacterium]|nr:hypothetical protein [Deltaproteobacteria bacterium]